VNQPLMHPKVALCLAAAARLQMDFDAEWRPDVKKQLLDIAVDFIDKTAPAPGREPELALLRRASQSQDQVAFLVEAGHMMLPVREYGWPARRVKPNQWPLDQAPALRALEQVLKQSCCPPQAAQALLTWLEPVWPKYPRLQDCCIAALTA